MSDAAVDSWFDRNHFLLRRVHSLTGVIPIGVFLIEHLYTNSLAWLGPEKFNEHVHWIHNLPYLFVIEMLFIFLPLAFHAGYGVVIARQAKHNVGQYNWGDNWRYTLQRVTGWIALVYLLIHLAHFRFGHLFGGPMYVGTPDPFAQTQEGFFALSWMPIGLWWAIYLVGLTASVYHFVNGLATFSITWGITVGDVARKRVAAGAAVLGVVMMVWGVTSLWALTRTMPDAAPAHRPVAAAVTPLGAE